MSNESNTIRGSPKTVTRLITDQISHSTVLFNFSVTKRKLRKEREDMMSTREKIEKKKRLDRRK